MYHYLAGYIIVVGANPVGRGKAESGKERVRGEDEAGEDGEVERHQHRELPPLVHCLHHPQEQRLQNLQVDDSRMLCRHFTTWFE